MSESLKNIVKREEKFSDVPQKIRVVLKKVGWVGFLERRLFLFFFRRGGALFSCE